MCLVWSAQRDVGKSRQKLKRKSKEKRKKVWIFANNDLKDYPKILEVINCWALYLNIGLLLILFLMF